jgi:hypothetical protein
LAQVKKNLSLYKTCSDKRKVILQQKMKEQDFKNHARIIPLFHGVTFLAALTVLVMAAIYFIKTIRNEDGVAVALMLLLVSGLLISLFFYARIFALKAQDRAIRAEENLRHFVLTGAPLDGRLNIQQVIALRFAPDEEFPALAKKAAAENLNSKSIKMNIKNWRADHHRV